MGPRLSPARLFLRHHRKPSGTEGTGLAPTDDAEAAVLLDIAAGSYIAIVSGVDSGTGVDLVEAFRIQ